MPETEAPFAGQVPLSETPDREWDVLIAGAGPAGSAAAIHAASRGHAVLLLDRDPFPRTKTCGDGLSPDAIRALENAGLREPVLRRAHPLGTASVYSPRGIELEVPGEYFTLPRRILDALLAGGAVERGACFVRGEVRRIAPLPAGGVEVEAAGASRPIRARYCILATGARVGLAGDLGMVQRRWPSAVAARCYVRSRLSLDRLVGAYDRSILPGYGWIFPLGDGLFNAGCALFMEEGRRPRVRLRDVFRTFLESFPLAREMMRKGEAVSPLRGAMMRCGLNGVSPIAGGRILAAGETIGTTFPCTGEGTGKALETGAMAADAVHEALEGGGGEALGSYAARLERELTPRYRRYESAQKWLSVGWVNDFLARRVQRSAYLQNAVQGLLADVRDPADIFSLRGLWKSLRG